MDQYPTIGGILCPPPFHMEFEIAVDLFGTNISIGYPCGINYTLLDPEKVTWCYIRTAYEDIPVVEVLTIK